MLAVSHLFHRLSATALVFLLLCLSSCCEWPPDPVCCNEMPPTPSRLWKPKRFCPMASCDPSCNKEERIMNKDKKLDMADLIDIALQNNPTTQQTWALARAAAYNVQMQESQLYPSVQLQEFLTFEEIKLDGDPLAGIAPAATTTTTTNAQQPLLRNAAFRQLNPAAQPNQTQTNKGSFGVGSDVLFNNNLSVSYLLLDFGGRQASIEAARQALYASDWTHNRQIQQVILSVLDSYYTYEGLVYLLKARESDLKNATENLNAAEQLFEAGIRNKLDVLQAQTDFVNIQINIIDLKGQARVTLSNLIANLGLPADTELAIMDISPDVPLAVVSTGVEELVKTARDRRPDLAAVYANHEQRRAEVTVARSAGLPTLMGNFNYDNNVYFHHVNLNNRVLMAGIAVTIPLFDGFFYASQTKRAKELLRASCADIRIVELNVILEVLTSYTNFKTAVESFKYSDKYLSISLEAYDAALLTYQEGIGTILDLLAAQRALANARAQRVQARTNWAISLAQIAFAIGVLGTDNPHYGTTMDR